MFLAGKKALVTGAKRRIGRGIVLALAEAGCDVGINDTERDDDAEQTLDLARKMGRKAEFYRADISDSAQVNRMVTEFVSEFGQIDILVNNPYWSHNMPFLEIDEATWDRTMNVCLKGFFLSSQAAGREMVKQGWGGSIVSTSSVHADRAWPNDAGYGVAKAGVLRLTESMARDLGQYGIRCNAIQPGYMNTDHVFGTEAPEVGSGPERTHAFIPLHRLGTPEDIGRAVAFLCSPAAGNITGVSLPVDGGLLVAGVP
jgi:3-oxoacyl-[acyl-carrier protein] reductase